MKSNKRAVGIAVVALALVATACGPTGGPGHIVVNEVRSIGQYRHPQGSGACSFSADVYVDKGERRVYIDGMISCMWYGIAADRCYFDITVFQGAASYNVESPERPCLEQPSQPVAQSFRCYGPADCTGSWSAEAGVMIIGYTGTTWRAKNTDECDPWEDGGRTIICAFDYNGKSVT